MASSMKGSSPKRGIRNNNPLNIRNGTSNWVGLDKAKSLAEPDFCVFSDAYFGIRAAAKILKRYKDKYGADTIATIVSRWAPSNENDTQNYIAFVAKQTGIPKDQPLSYSQYRAVIQAMIIMESGSCPYEPELIAAAVQTAKL